MIYDSLDQLSRYKTFPPILGGFWVYFLTTPTPPDWRTAYRVP